MAVIFTTINVESMPMQAIEELRPVHECTLCQKTFKSNMNLKLHMRRHADAKPYTCTYCDKQFSDSSNLKSHVRIHTNEKPYKCRFCTRQFVQASNLKTHERTHTKEKPYVCIYCERGFARSTHLQSHMIVHTGGMPHKCPECSEIFARPKQLKVHRMMKHGIGQIYWCATCERPFDVPSALKSHMDWHKRQGSYGCNDCPKKFNSIRALERHIKVFHRRKNRPSDPAAAEEEMDDFDADDCEEMENGGIKREVGEIYGSESEEEMAAVQADNVDTGIHGSIATETGEMADNVGVCYDNGSNFLGESSQLSAVEIGSGADGENYGVVDEDIRMFVDSTLRDPDDTQAYAVDAGDAGAGGITETGEIVDDSAQSITLQYFDAADSGEQSKPYIGQLADGQMVVLIPNDMSTDEAHEFIMRHFPNVNTELQPKLEGEELAALNTATDTVQSIAYEDLQNPEDGTIEPPYVEISESHVKQDVTEVNTDVVFGSFPCDLCGKVYHTLLNLQRHAKSHSVERTHPCKYCSKMFADTSNLKTHVRTHTLEKPYACSYCEHRFAQRSNLKTHERTHRNEKRFACRYCGKTFARSTHVQGHMVVHTGAMPLGCSDCTEVFVSPAKLREHRACVHGVGDSYVCAHCDEVFASQFKLDRHARTHAGDLPYHCRDCPRQFAYASFLKLHMPHHADMKPYGCAVCQKQFVSLYTAKAHIAGHLKLK